MKNKNVSTSLSFLSIAFLCLVAFTKIVPSTSWLLPIGTILLQLYLFLHADVFCAYEKGSQKWKIYRFLTFFGIAFCMAMYLLLYVHSPENPQSQRTYLVFLFLLIFGNYAPRIPFNRSLGLRLPWTVRSESTWRYAHRIVGYTSIPCAFLFLFVSLFDNDTYLGCILLLWVLIPSIASYYYDKVERNQIHETKI